MKYQDAKKRGVVKNLIPAHINKCRCDKYFWNWSFDSKDWIRAGKIPESLNRAYKNPPIDSSYM